MASQGYCPSCGTKLHAEWTFCGTCGAHLPSGPAFDPTISKENAKEPWHDSGWVMLAALLFLWPIGIVLLWISPTVKRSSKIAVSIMTASLFFAVTASLIRSSGSPFESSSSAASPGSCLVIVMEMREMTTANGGTTINGTMRNDCGRSYSYVEIAYKLFDSDGNVVGTALANQNDLGAGERWSFHAVGVANSDHYQLGEITAY
ncbi:MAG: FxLYD domain-containing protein [Terracidiphilus sp.]